MLAEWAVVRDIQFFGLAANLIIQKKTLRERRASVYEDVVSINLDTAARFRHGNVQSDYPS